MQKREQLYQGKAKTLYGTDDPDRVIIHYRDDATAFDGTKKASLANKGRVNNYFNAYIMQQLQAVGIATHFEKVINDNETVAKYLQMIPVECVVRNIAAGSICRRLGIQEGLKLDRPIFEFFLKNDALHDPMINDYHILVFGWATAAEIEFMKKQTFKINGILKPLFSDAGMLLVDYKLEFGRFHGKVLLGDEFTPDGCRIWDSQTLEKLDKDRFRQDLGHVIESYQIAAERLKVPMGV